jgi:hypothetical protein
MKYPGGQDTRRGSEVSEVESILTTQMELLPAAHRTALERALIVPRKVSVRGKSGGFVVAVAAFGERLLYWSDIEEGWELEQPDARGCITRRGCNQFDLRHLLYQVLGPPT